MSTKVREIADRPRRSPRASCAHDGCRPANRIRYDDVLRGRYHLGARDECDHPDCQQEEER